MAAVGYADSRAIFGTAVPKLWNASPRRSIFGDVIVVAFLLAQAFDGIFTYVGVVVYGAGIEANPLLATLMAYLGHGAALMTAKSVAGCLGIGLHLRGIHSAVAVLVGFYLAAAILPWIAILFF
jgi:hypothetical protein